jgi:hypothetical protein
LAMILQFQKKETDMYRVCSFEAVRKNKLSV